MKREMKSIVRVELDLNELSIIELTLKDMRLELKKEMQTLITAKSKKLVAEDVSDVSGLILKIGSAVTRFERKYGR